MEVSLYGDLMDEDEREDMIQGLADPLFGESFSLASYITRKGGIDAIPSRRQAGSEFSASAGKAESYTIRSNPVFYGIPPPVYSDMSPHNSEAIVIVHNLPSSTNEADLRRNCADSIGHLRVVRMLISDPSTGVFCGTVILEFQTTESAEKALSLGVTGHQARRPTRRELDFFISGSFPPLDLGPLDFTIQQRITANNFN